MSQNADQPATNQKQRSTAALLALFLGVFGAHQFYLGNNVSGIIRIVMTITMYGVVISLPLAIIEFVLYMTASDDEFHDTYVLRRKAWPWQTPSTRNQEDGATLASGTSMVDATGTSTPGASEPSVATASGTSTAAASGPKTNKGLVIGIIAGAILLIFIGCVAMVAGSVNDDLNRIDRLNDQFDRALDQNDRAQDQLDRLLDE